MTPDLVELARAYMATERAITPAPHLWIEGDVRHNADGTRWERHVGQWLPDLSDAATGGVLLAHHEITEAGRMASIGGAVYARGVGWCYGASYGEAVARAVIETSARKAGT